jgi:hypothetical protein
MNAQSLNEKDLTRIRSFLAVADEKSFTRAREALFQTQQAVSRPCSKVGANPSVSNLSDGLPALFGLPQAEGPLLLPRLRSWSNWTRSELPP